MKKVLMFLITFSFGLCAQSEWINIGLDGITPTNIVVFSRDSIVANSYPNIYTTTNGGDSWDSKEMTQCSGESLCKDKNGYLYIAGQGGVLKSTDYGDSWVRIDSSIIDKEFYTVAVFGNTIYTSNFDNIFFSSDGGENWIPTNYNYSGATNIQKDDKYLFVGNTLLSYSGFYYSNDNGNSWGYHYFWIDDYISYGNGNILLRSSLNRFGNNPGLYHSSDYGLTWQFTDNLSSSDIATNHISVNQNGRVYIAIYNITTGERGVYTAGNYNKPFLNIGLDGKFINSMVLDNSGTLYAGVVNEGIYYINYVTPVELTTFTATIKDNNVTLSWKTASELNNKGFEVESKTTDTEWAKIGFINGNGTTNETQSYHFTTTPKTFGTVQYRLKQVDFDGTYDYSDVVEVEYTPNKYELKQNYPNPFNPETIIEFTLPQKEWVTLRVYNISGELVTTLLNKTMQAGIHKINFKAGNIPSGIYFYTLKTKNTELTQKMVLLK